MDDSYQPTDATTQPEVALLQQVTRELSRQVTCSRQKTTRLISSIRSVQSETDSIVACLGLLTSEMETAHAEAAQRRIDINASAERFSHAAASLLTIRNQLADAVATIQAALHACSAINDDVHEPSPALVHKG